MRKRKVQALSLALTLSLASSMMIPTMAAGATFADVPETHWAYAQIEQAYANGIISGTSYDAQTGIRMFSPNDTMSEAQFLAILCKNYFPEQYEEYTKINNGSWSSGAAVTGWKTGLISMQEGIYNASTAFLDRYQMASICLNLLKIQGVPMPTDNELKVVQSKIGDWERINSSNQESVATMVYFGIISGTDSKGSFCGWDYVTRAQGAVIYQQLIKVIEEKGQQEVNTPTTDTEVFMPQEPSDGSTQTPSQDISSNDAPNNDTSDVEEQSPTQDVSSEVDLDTLREEMLALMNRERANVGVSSLKLDDEICDVAQVRANELLESYSHTRPSGESCFTALDEAGVRYGWVGENIAAGQRSVEKVMDAWMNSSGHRANILDSNFKKVGIGFVRPEDGYGYYWVQMFTD